jgi:hypothetical protein
MGQTSPTRHRDQHRRWLPTKEHEELARLRREHKRLTVDLEILKRATDFFAAEIPSPEADNTSHRHRDTFP